jgi:hypothetical protein
MGKRETILKDDNRMYKQGNGKRIWGKKERLMYKREGGKEERG